MMTPAQKNSLEKLAFGTEAQCQMAMQTAIGTGDDAVKFVCDRIMVKWFIEWIKRNANLDVEINTNQTIDQMAHPKIAKHAKKLMRKSLKKWGLEKSIKV